MKISLRGSLKSSGNKVLLKVFLLWMNPCCLPDSVSQRFCLVFVSLEFACSLRPRSSRHFGKCVLFCVTSLLWYGIYQGGYELSLCAVRGCRVCTPLVLKDTPLSPCPSHRAHANLLTWGQHVQRAGRFQAEQSCLGAFLPLGDQTWDSDLHCFCPSSKTPHLIAPLPNNSPSNLPPLHESVNFVQHKC